ncbi:MAG: hypothetical protein AAB805_01560 [Patescibacteria group bacterium]
MKVIAVIALIFIFLYAIGRRVLGYDKRKKRTPIIFAVMVGTIEVVYGVDWLIFESWRQRPKKRPRKAA